MGWSDLNGEHVAFVGDLENLGPDEAVKTNSIFVDDKSSGADSNVDHLTDCILTSRNFYITLALSFMLDSKNLRK